MRLLIALLLSLFLLPMSWSQDTADPGDEPSEAAEASETTADEEEDEDDSYLDEQGHLDEEDEDDFIPSQEVTADQSLRFPVDI